MRDELKIGLGRTEVETLFATLCHVGFAGIPGTPGAVLCGLVDKLEAFLGEDRAEGLLGGDWFVAGADLLVPATGDPDEDRRRGLQAIEFGRNMITLGDYARRVASEVDGAAEAADDAEDNNGK